MKTWFITGISSGFGLALAEAVLAKGDRVVGTLRNDDQCHQFNQLHKGRSIGLKLDITDHEAVRAGVSKIEAEVGPIDVLVNNAGYGYEATIEEASMNEIRRQFEVNVFGTLAVIRAVLPYMRQRRRGHILNVTSVGGIVTFPGLGIYHGSKFALEGISETLAKEVAGFGIQVTTVEPGMFRTNWAGHSLAREPQTIADYESLFAPIRLARKERDGKQLGDPHKAALAMIAATEANPAPVHLLLGPDALAYATTKLTELSSEFTRWEALTCSTNFD